MKKQVLAIALAFGITGAFAQDLTSKKGEKFLPEANDWAIGFNADGLIRNLGGLMGRDSVDGVLTNSFGQTIVGKMFADEKTAYRAMVGINLRSTTSKALVAKAGSPTDQVEDVTKTSRTDITLGGGIEMRRGNTRLQGYYGGMLGIMFGNGAGKTTTEYGNVIDANNQVLTPRTTETKTGSTFGIMLDGFIGAEYFIVPKISIGAEYHWGVQFISQGATSQSTEVWNPALNNNAGGVEKKTVDTNAGGGSFDLGVNNMTGGANAVLMATFHF